MHGSIDGEASTGSKRSSLVDSPFNSSSSASSSNKKEGRFCEMGEDLRLANSRSASVCQLGGSNFLQEEAPSWHHREEILESLLLEAGVFEWDDQFEQSSCGAQEFSNYQHRLQMFKSYNSSIEDVQKVSEHVLFSKVGVLEGSLTSTSGCSVVHNVQQGEQKGDLLSSELQNNGKNLIDADQSYEGSSGKQNGSEEFMEDDMATMDLTDDLLHLVFSFLDQKSLCFSTLVCRQWRIASAHEDFWKCLSFEDENVTKEKVGWLCNKFPRAVELTLREVPFIDEVAREAMFSPQGLRNLNLHKGILTESFFTALASGCFACSSCQLLMQLAPRKS